MMLGKGLDLLDHSFILLTPTINDIMKLYSRATGVKPNLKPHNLSKIIFNLRHQLYYTENSTISVT